MSFDRSVDPATPWVERFAGLMPEGQSVLDVACGTSARPHGLLKFYDFC